MGFVALGILGVGAVASILGARAWSSYVGGQQIQSFSSVATASARELDLALLRASDVSATARTLIETSPGLTNQQFATWFRLLDTRNQYPGSFGLVYIENVSASQLGTFEQRVTSDPPFGLARSGSFSLVPPQATSPYCLARAGVFQLPAGVKISSLSSLLTFTEPNLDFCALPIGRLLRGSAASGKPAVLSLSALLKASPRLPGVPRVPASLPRFVARGDLIVTLTPIYATGSTPSTPALRRQSVTGWVLAVFQGSSMLNLAIAGHRGVSATLGFTDAAGARMVLARVGSPGRNALTQTFRLTTPGDWTVTLSEPPPGSGLSASQQGLAVVGGGLLVSLLFFLLISVLSRSRSHALQIVEKRTSELRHQALHDGLTDLPNRELIFDRADQMLARARRDQSNVAALFLDLDQFKDINDTFGHGAGDELLRQAAERFSVAVRETDTVGRLGGDEFVVLLENTSDTLAPEHVAEKLLDSLREPFHLGKERRTVTLVSASIGIASGIRDTSEELLRDADIALYEAKASGRDHYVVFEKAMHAGITARVELEAALRDALRDEQFFLVYQPISNLSHDRIVSAEALLRWRHPDRGVVLPSEILPTLEATGMILDVGRFVLERACEHAAEWHRDGHSVGVSVNASASQLDRTDFVEHVHGALASSGLPPDALTIEITETTLMRNGERSATRLDALKSLGVNLSIDDFGTGYCSFSYLQQFPVDSLKIDQSFVQGVGSSPGGAALLHTLVQLGKNLNIRTVAEGIETLLQLTMLRLEDCDMGQGHLLARPYDVWDLRRLLAEGNSQPVQAEQPPTLTVLADGPKHLAHGSGDGSRLAVHTRLIK